MDSRMTDLFGLALSVFFEGDGDAELTIRREDGHEILLPVRHFFRESSELSKIEETALDLCRGHVLDVGAGAKIHSLFLQEKGLRVSAVDVSPQAWRS